MKYYLLSLKHTKKSDKHMTFWRPNDRGYTYCLNVAGIYIDIEEGYHSSENTKPISVEEIEKIQIHDSLEGYVVENNKKNREILGI